jgi:hypothetical protein
MFARPLPAMMGVLWLVTLAACDATPARGRPAAREAPRAAELRSGAVQAAFLAAGRALRTRGFAPIGDEQRGFVVSRASVVHAAPLRSGRCYVAVGAGSAAIAALELTLHDSEGASVAEAPRTAGARSALRYCPPQSGTFYLAARAASGSGIVALRVFEGPGGLEVRVDDLFAASPDPDGTP